MPRSKDDTKTEAIYKATLDLLTEHRYHELTIAEIAERAQLATGTIYTYFINKEDLINRLFLHLKTQKMKDLLKVVSEEDSFFVSFKKLWYAYFALSFEKSHEMKFIEQFTYSPLLTAETRDKSDALLQPLISLLEKARQEDLIKEIPPEIILSHFTGSILEVIRLFLNKGIVPDTETLEGCFEMAWNSIRK